MCNRPIQINKNTQKTTWGCGRIDAISVGAWMLLHHLLHFFQFCYVFVMTPPQALHMSHHELHCATHPSLLTRIHTSEKIVTLTCLYMYSVNPHFNPSFTLCDVISFVCNYTWCTAPSTSAVLEIRSTVPPSMSRDNCSFCRMVLRLLSRQRTFSIWEHMDLISSGTI